jgi:hypothetical protein
MHLLTINKGRPKLFTTAKAEDIFRDPADTKHCDADPNSSFHFEADPDTTVHFDADPDPFPHQSAPGLQALHDTILSLNASIVSAKGNL